MRELALDAEDSGRFKAPLAPGSLENGTDPVAVCQGLRKPLDLSEDLGSSGHLGHILWEARGSQRGGLCHSLCDGLRTGL